MDHLWLVEPETRRLVSPYRRHADSKPLVAAQPFTAAVVSIVVDEDLDGFLRGNNDILVLTRSSLGEHPLVERVHYFEEGVEKGRPIRNLLADTMFVCEDYSGQDRLWLELNVVEVDTDTGERKAALNAFEAMASSAGAVFPAVLPYATGATAVLRVVEKLVGALERDEDVVKIPVAFHPGRERIGRAPLQEGTFVATSRPVDPSRLKLGESGVLTGAGKSPGLSYIVFEIFGQRSPSPALVLNQKIATLLTQLRDRNAGTARSTMDFLGETVASYAHFGRLRRHLELREKGADASPEEKALMAAIERTEALKPFLPEF